MNSTLAHADQKEATCFTAEFSICIEKSSGVTIDMVNCIEAERKAVQSKIEVLYKEIVSNQSAERNAELDNVIQVWKSYRKEMGNFLYDPDGGSMAKIISLDWTLSETERLCVLLKSMQ